MILILAAMTLGTADMPNGARLAAGSTCYTITSTRGGMARPIGVTLQTVSRGRERGRGTLRVSIHQRVGAGSFDMHDRFLLDARTLRPISLASRRNGRPHAQLRYGEGRIRGVKHNPDGSVTRIDIATRGPVWEGNLYGLTFAALPLADGAQFNIPVWQYDRGFGTFTVRVLGSRTLEVGSDEIEAWVVEARSFGAEPLTYFIAKSDHRELGYTAGPGGQMVGGDCSRLGE